MTKKERLFDAFGELLYAIIHTNQNIKDKNTYLDITDKIARKYRITRHIDWTVNYERRNAHSIDNAYMRALMACRDNGPDPDYIDLFDLLQYTTNLNKNLTEKDIDLISGFESALKEIFIQADKEGRLRFRR
ncbi:MAG: hypothetical protein ACPG5B_09560 [Chitinophagales bacterium]